MTTRLEHFARFLGEPGTQERILLDRVGRSIGLLRYEGQPCEGATTVVTSGLSDLEHHLLHEELVLTLWSQEVSVDVVRVLEHVARLLAQGREPLAHGDVIGPYGPLCDGTDMSAIYVAEPAYFPEEFAHFVTNDRCTTRMRWLVPIHTAEVRLIERSGAAHFEALLTAQDPDLLSLQRPPVSEPAPG